VIRVFIRLQYSPLSSIFTLFLLYFSHTLHTVPDPAKGSIIAHGFKSGIGFVLHLQIGCQPTVLVSGPLSFLYFLVAKVTFPGYWLFAFLISGTAFSTILSQGLPHSTQHPFSDVPAIIHGNISAGGKVAKWASLYGFVGTVHTERLFQPLTGKHTAFTKLLFCFTIPSDFIDFGVAPFPVVVFAPAALASDILFISAFEI